MEVSGVIVFGKCYETAGVDFYAHVYFVDAQNPREILLQLRSQRVNRMENEPAMQCRICGFADDSAVPCGFQNYFPDIIFILLEHNEAVCQRV